MSAGIDRGRVALRALMPADARTVRALIAPEFGELGSEGQRSALEAVISERDPDSRGLTAVDGEHVVGCIIFGAIAGAVAAGRIQLVVVDAEARRRGIATRMIAEASAALADDGHRVIFVEMPDAPGFAPSMLLLATCGFHVDARVADYFRDGVDLVILRQEIAPGTRRHSGRSISS